MTIAAEGVPISCLHGAGLQLAPRGNDLGWLPTVPFGQLGVDLVVGLQWQQWVGGSVIALFRVAWSC